MTFAMRFLGLLWTISPQFLSATTAAEQYQTNTNDNCNVHRKAHTPLNASYKMQEVAVVPKYIKKTL